MPPTTDIAPSSDVTLIIGPDKASFKVYSQVLKTSSKVFAAMLNRQFREHFGATPLELLARMRVDRARRLLESTELTVDRVAAQSGFGCYASLRYHFLRTAGVSPQRYRQNYTAGR